MRAGKNGCKYLSSIWMLQRAEIIGKATPIMGSPESQQILNKKSKKPREVIIPTSPMLTPSLRYSPGRLKIGLRKPKREATLFMQ